MGAVQHLLARLMTYHPRDSREEAARELWMDAAFKGGFFWSSLVGTYHAAHGWTPLNDMCPCKFDIECDDEAHEGHADLREQAVRDVFETTIQRRAQRVGRWLMRHSVRRV